MFAYEIKTRTVERLSFEFYMMLSRCHNIDERYRETKSLRNSLKLLYTKSFKIMRMLHLLYINV